MINKIVFKQLNPETSVNSLNLPRFCEIPLKVFQVTYFETIDLKTGAIYNSLKISVLKIVTAQNWSSFFRMFQKSYVGLLENAASTQTA